MKPTKKIGEEYLDKIISVAYKDANLLDRLKIYFDARRDSDIKKILNEYRTTAKGVHSLQQEEFHGESAILKDKRSNLLLNYINIFFRRPVISTAMALMILAGVTGYFIVDRNNSTNGYSQTELAVAEKQAKESFAIVASIMNKTENKLRNEVFYQKINRPINKTITILNTYL